MGNRSSHTPISNSCSREIRIYFDSSMLDIQEIALEVTTQAGVNVGEKVEGSLQSGRKVNVLLKPESRIQYMRCPPNKIINIPKQGDFFVSITCDRGSEVELMCFNLYIPRDHSIIVYDSGITNISC